MDELLDLVNEKDEVIGEVWRSEVFGDKSKIFREVAVLICDHQNRLLLQRRSYNKKAYPGFWIISAGGHVGKGQNPDDVVHKELREELGFGVPLVLKEKRLMEYKDNRSMAYCYEGEYSGEFKIQPEEVEEARFFSKDEFEELVKKDKVEPSSEEWCRKFWNK